jgi:hypothetical protein
MLNKNAEGHTLDDERDLDAVITAIRNQLPSSWAVWPGGWPGEVEAALLDAVLSIRATYGQEINGVRGAIGRWRAIRQFETLDDLDALATCEPDVLADAIGNHQKLSSGSPKTFAIVQAAQNLVAIGLRHAADLTQPTEDHKRAYTSVYGLGPVTWAYLVMLLGKPDVKADTWIMRFVAGALGRPTSPAESRELLHRAASALDVSPTALDHAIWSYIRTAGPSRT